MAIHAYQLRLTRVVEALDNILRRDNLCIELRQQLLAVRHLAIVRKYPPRKPRTPVADQLEHFVTVGQAAQAAVDKIIDNSRPEPADPLLSALRRESITT